MRRTETEATLSARSFPHIMKRCDTDAHLNAKLYPSSNLGGACGSQSAVLPSVDCKYSSDKSGASKRTSDADQSSSVERTSGVCPGAENALPIPHQHMLHPYLSLPIPHQHMLHPYSDHLLTVSALPPSRIAPGSDSLGGWSLLQSEDQCDYYVITM